MKDRQSGDEGHFLAKIFVFFVLQVLCVYCILKRPEKRGRARGSEKDS